MPCKTVWEAATNKNEKNILLIYPSEKEVLYVIS
jgi:hypothetical protein